MWYRKMVCRCVCKHNKRFSVPVPVCVKECKVCVCVRVCVVVCEYEDGVRQCGHKTGVR